MKGKLAFVLGAAVGYVLGSRAGRERYEQIKRGAERVWETPTVQRGVDAVRDVVDERVHDVTEFAKRVGADAVSGLIAKATGSRNPGARPQRSTAAASGASGATGPASAGYGARSSPEGAQAASHAAEAAASIDAVESDAQNLESLAAEAEASGADDTAAKTPRSARGSRKASS